MTTRDRNQEHRPPQVANFQSEREYSCGFGVSLKVSWLQIGIPVSLLSLPPVLCWTILFPPPAPSVRDLLLCILSNRALISPSSPITSAFFHQVVSIGHSTTEALRAEGIQHISEMAKPTPYDLLEALGRA